MDQKCNEGAGRTGNGLVTDNLEKGLDVPESYGILVLWFRGLDESSKTIV